MVSMLVGDEQQVRLHVLDRRIVELHPTLREPFHGAERVDENRAVHR